MQPFILSNKSCSLFSSSILFPLSPKEKQPIQAHALFWLFHIISFSFSMSYKSSIQIFVFTICITLAAASIRDTIPFFCRYSPLKKYTAVTISFFLICCNFQSSSSKYSSDSSILGTTIFSFFRNASGYPFSAANGINCFARSSRFICPLYPTFMPSYLTVPFHRSGACLQVHPF